jgi:hypothetical protein
LLPNIGLSLLVSSSYTHPNLNLSTGEYWKTRVDLLNGEDKAAAIPFAEREMIVMKERIIVGLNTKEVKDRLSELLFD